MVFLTEAISDITWSDVFTKILNWCKTDGLKIIIGLIVVLILMKLTDVVFRKIRNRLIKKRADKTASIVLTNFFRIVTKTLLILVYLVFIGFDTAAIGSAIASIGIAIGLALQGGLSNFAAGVIILFTRPFRIDDYIECEDVQGTVEAIDLFYTKLRSFDNKLVVVPNSKLTSSPTINYTIKPTRRVDITVQMAYDSNFEQVKAAFQELVKDNDKILQTPSAQVDISEYQDSGIKLFMRVWVKNEDYWTVKFALQNNLKTILDKYGVTIPFPQVDVHIKNDN